uniref:Uncharacterized protein n=2 Tax=Caenorhabditis japonica TaxID=281687 RepID=A0A8R1EIH0_CAEJA
MSVTVIYFSLNGLRSHSFNSVKISADISLEKLQQLEECRTQSISIPSDELLSNDRSKKQLKTSKESSNHTNHQPISAIPGRLKRKPIIDMKVLPCMPEHKPLICSGNADDAQ